MKRDAEDDKHSNPASSGAPEFRTSFTARGLLASVSLALIGVGLVPILGLRADTAIPLILVGATLVAMVSMIMGVMDHPGPLVLTIVAFPMMLWGFVFVSLYASTRPLMGTSLVAAGILVASFGVLSQLSLPARHRRSARAA